MVVAQKSTLRDKQKIDKIKKVVRKDAERSDCYRVQKRFMIYLQSTLTPRQSASYGLALPCSTCSVRRPKCEKSWHD